MSPRLVQGVVISHVSIEIECFRKPDLLVFAYQPKEIRECGPTRDEIIQRVGSNRRIKVRPPILNLSTQKHGLDIDARIVVEYPYQPAVGILKFRQLIACAIERTVIQPWFVVSLMVHVARAPGLERSNRTKDIDSMRRIILHKLLPVLSDNRIPAHEQPRRVAYRRKPMSVGGSQRLWIH